MLFQGYFSFFLEEVPLIKIYIFAIWYFLNTLDVNGIAVQFLYRYLGLNCRITINILRYTYLATIPFIASLLLAISWFFMVAKDQLNKQNLDISYFSYFMDRDAAENYIAVTYSFNSMDLVIYWSYSYQILQIICYVIVIFCGVKMIRFVHIHSSLTQKMKELNKQLIITLIILASFPLILMSTNTFISSVAPHFIDLNTESLLFMFQGLLSHWLPLLNPLASIYTMRPYREFLIQKVFKIKTKTQKVTPVTILVQQNSKYGNSKI
uniref:Uncharacterized protein n=1 Tax=Meloidogyne enterolobii TaxID=390850 RepID=A0A6V7WEH1_MELEN|nr:unnamed protein product [Meloidogyne enterolobii]